MFNEEIPDYKGYNGNPLIKRKGVQIQWTPEQLQEYIKCSKDPIYFIEKYMKIIHVDRGLVNFSMYDYQEEMVSTMAENRFTLIGTCRQAGKALPLFTKIPTPNGWKLMKEINVNDLVFDENGNETKVTAISKTFENNDCYKLTFDDGSFVIADANHIWTVTNRNKKINLTSEQLFNQKVTYIDKRKKLVSKFRIQNTKPVNYSYKEVKIHPYILGLWLGDGHSDGGRITGLIEDINEYKKIFNSLSLNETFSENHRKDHIYTGTISDLCKKLKEYNLIKNKHIPKDYLFNSIEFRKELLRGLMDSDGWVEKTRNAISFSYNRYPQLIEDVYELLCSLGLKVFRKEYTKTNSVRLFFHCSKEMFSVFHLERKLSKQQEKTKNKKYVSGRYIRKIEKVNSVPTKCITVDNPSHLFLCSNHYIPTHNSTSTSGFILWYIIFHSEKTVALLANKGETAREILGKVQLAYQHLPKWLQQGVVEWNKGSFVLENNSRVIAAATSSDNIRGYSISLLFIDEAAHIENWDEFFASVFPTISSGSTTKVVLVSTPNGLNHFYKLWEQSEQGLNDYKRVKVLWNQVPGRDEKWREITLAAMGYDYQKFAQEHEMEFLGSSGTLIAGWKLKELVHKVPYYSKININQYEQPQENRIYVLIADVSEGKGLDYSAFQIIDVTEMPYKQVCTFRDNMITPIDYAEIIHRLAIAYNKAAILIETNNIGQQIAENIYYEYEYENMVHTINSGRLGKTTSMGFGKPADKGVKTTKSVKSIGCSMIKMLVEGNHLIINDHETIKEFSTFSRKNNSFEAESGNNDDLVMCLVLFGWLTDQTFFKEYTDINTLNRMREKTDEELMEDVIPFGFVDNGIGYEDELKQEEENNNIIHVSFL